MPAGQQLQVTHVGFDGTDFTGGSAIAALVKLEGVIYDYPDSGDLSTPDVVIKRASPFLRLHPDLRPCGCR